MGVSPGSSISHVVLTVRDIEASHAFYTTVLGFEQSGKFRSHLFPDIDMRFYRGDATRHHDLARPTVPGSVLAAAGRAVQYVRQPGRSEPPRDLFPVV